MSELAGNLFTCSVRFASSNIEGIYSAQPDYFPKLGQYLRFVSFTLFDADHFSYEGTSLMKRHFY